MANGVNNNVHFGTPAPIIKPKQSLLDEEIRCLGDHYVEDFHETAKRVDYWRSVQGEIARNMFDAQKMGRLDKVARLRFLHAQRQAEQAYFEAKNHLNEIEYKSRKLDCGIFR